MKNKQMLTNKSINYRNHMEVNVSCNQIVAKNDKNVYGKSVGLHIKL